MPCIVVGGNRNIVPSAGGQYKKGLSISQDGGATWIKKTRDDGLGDNAVYSVLREIFNCLLLILKNF